MIILHFFSLGLQTFIWCSFIKHAPSAMFVIPTSHQSCCFCCCATVKVQYTRSKRELNNNIYQTHQVTKSRFAFSLQSADASVHGPQHAEEFQRERRDLHPGAHRRQPIRHGAGHGGQRQQEETLQPQRAGGGHRWQPSQPQHVADQRPRWVGGFRDLLEFHRTVFFKKNLKLKILDHVSFLEADMTIFRKEGGDT